MCAAHRNLKKKSKSTQQTDERMDSEKFLRIKYINTHIHIQSNVIMRITAFCKKMWVSENIINAIFVYARCRRGKIEHIARTVQRQHTEKST